MNNELSYEKAKRFMKFQEGLSLEKFKEFIIVAGDMCEEAKEQERHSTTQKMIEILEELKREITKEIEENGLICELGIETIIDSKINELKSQIGGLE